MFTYARALNGECVCAGKNSPKKVCPANRNIWQVRSSFSLGFVEEICLLSISSVKKK